MRRILILLLGLSGAAHAVETTLPIPGQGWQVSFDAPELTKVGEQDRPGQYVYVANSGRFNLSLYVEAPSCSGGSRHEDYYNCFWPKSSRNPMIVQSSVRATEGPRYYKVVYDVQAPFEGRTITQRNVNFLIAYRGKWTDLHVSVIEPTSDDLARLEAFEASLDYAEAGKASTEN
jgi:hypothetical protein